MANFEYLGYVETPAEKHRGVATVRAWGKIVLRYKIVDKKEGGGFFCGIAGLKMPSEDSSDDFESVFCIEFNSEKDECEKLIRTKVKKYYDDLMPQNNLSNQQTNVQNNNSQQQSSSGQNQNYYQNPPDIDYGNAPPQQQMAFEGSLFDNQPPPF